MPTLWHPCLEQATAKRLTFSDMNMQAAFTAASLHQWSYKDPQTIELAIIQLDKGPGVKCALANVFFYTMCAPITTALLRRFPVEPTSI